MRVLISGINKQVNEFVNKALACTLYILCALYKWVISVYSEYISGVNVKCLIAVFTVIKNEFSQTLGKVDYLFIFARGYIYQCIL